MSISRLIVNFKNIGLFQIQGVIKNSKIVRDVLKSFEILSTPNSFKNNSYIIKKLNKMQQIMNVNVMLQPLGSYSSFKIHKSSKIFQRLISECLNLFKCYIFIFKIFESDKKFLLFNNFFQN